MKKNKSVLDHLLRWIRNHVADAKDADGRPLVSGFPLLLIDDEADHASVDTGDQTVNKDGKRGSMAFAGGSVGKGAHGER